MKWLKHKWNRTPHHIRRPVVFTIGWIVIIISGSIGWLPGPGGIPLFLLGVAILSTEFEWADRVKQFFLGLVLQFGAWYRQNRALGRAVIASWLLISISIAYMVINT